jgi:hypothetical protein
VNGFTKASSASGSPSLASHFNPCKLENELPHP